MNLSQSTKYKQLCALQKRSNRTVWFLHTVNPDHSSLEISEPRRPQRCRFPGLNWNSLWRVFLHDPQERWRQKPISVRFLLLLKLENSQIEIITKKSASRNLVCGFAWICSAMQCICCEYASNSLVFSTMLPFVNVTAGLHRPPSSN